ncbi:glycosyl transferase [Paenibacillus sp. IHB B 3084]|uniref:glycosyltransferase family 2 protein n=1 Tax=Paenibacillus TaxID=44249 RepID=UPI000721ABD0|nr:MULTISPECIES: glycosyltransferase family 2 protein [Paenibacillus]ALP37841.1 glycosyl transferase [Paenibacillus sp. IHB B 3084]
MQGPIAIFSDNHRAIDYPNVIYFYEYIQCEDQEVTSAYEDACCCLIDYREPGQAVRVANQIRSRFPQMPLLLVTDVSHPFSDHHMVQITGIGRLRLLFWQANDNEEMLSEIQSLLYPEYSAKSRHIAFILSVYNEEQRFVHVKKFAERLQAFIRSHIVEGSIYLIDDGSHDGTNALIKALEAATDLSVNRINQNLSPLLQTRELGRNTRKAGTYLEGMRTIGADYYVFVDADDSFFIEDIARMINVVRQGYYDVVIGTKDMTAENRSLLRSVVSFGKRVISRPFLPTGVVDSQTGLKVMSSVAVKRMFPHLKEQLGLALDLEMMFIAKRLQLRVLQLPVKCIDRDGSHIHVWKDSIRFLRSIIDIWWLDRRVR